MSQLETFASETKGSGFIISGVDKFHIKFCKYAFHNRIEEFTPYPKGVHGCYEINSSVVEYHGEVYEGWWNSLVLLTNQ